MDFGKTMTHRLERMKLWSVIVLCLTLLGSALPGHALAQEAEPAKEEALLPFRYVRIWDKPVSVYATPGDPARMTPVTTLLPPDSWVSIDEEIEQDGQQRAERGCHQGLPQERTHDQNWK